nr:alpha-hydroxy-acid oxidizing protein [Kocuria sp. SL71]
MVQPLRALPRIREALGPDAEVIYDSGILSGTDAIIALALGADFTLIGRAYLYGLMAGGQEGVERALELLEQEMRVTMHLLGVATVDELHPGLITGA